MTGVIPADLILLEKAVAKLASRPAFMAHPLSIVFAGDVSASHITAELNCRPTDALRLALMAVPRSGRELFREDLSRIAKATGIDRTRLLTLLRQAQSLIAFGADTQGSDRGTLLAA